MNRLWLWMLGAVAVGAMAVACTTAAPQMPANEAIAARQQLMKEQGAAMRAIQDKMKAGQAQAIGPETQKLIATAKRITVLFPAGSLDPKVSRAKPQIWQDWQKFGGFAKTLEQKATQLSVVAAAGPDTAVGPVVADLGKTTCGACHDAFRGPEIKK